MEKDTINTSSNNNNFKPYDQIASEDAEQLYDAYNQLHTLAQDFQKPFDCPAVVVVGHQTCGKSALIEALMGFQFNQVGGGTKTRRPIALRMQYNPTASVPICFLANDNGKEEQKSLHEIQTYIELENKRLERDPTRSYDSREINIRIEYRYCPNMIIIDTPGMLHAPKGANLNPQQRALARAAKEAELLVLSKLKCQDYIILCVEDTTDWKHATTRNIVMQADPMLSRTVLVTTKLDTKLPQFSEGIDLMDFLSASVIDKLYPQLYGGPFYTSVPSGRVGLSSGFGTNEEFVNEVLSTEKKDMRLIQYRLDEMGSGTDGNEYISKLKTVGVTKLRTFLEKRIEESYRRNIAKIVPMLQIEYKKAEDRLGVIEDELSSLSLEKLKEGSNAYREKFAKELERSIHGTANASPLEWGETLVTEQMRAGSFLTDSQVKSEAWQTLLDLEVGNAQHRLFGGAQYHRALREFTAAVRHMSLSSVSEDEIANAAGMGDTHDGVNFMRAACVLAMNKAHQTFDPILETLNVRAAHVMRRMFPLVESMIYNDEKRGIFKTSIPQQLRSKTFQSCVKKIYEKFIDDQMNYCMNICRDDLQGMTRFVTWDVDGRGGSSALYKSMPTPHRMVEIYKLAIDKNQEKDMKDKKYDKTSNLKGKSGSVDKDQVYKQWLLANRGSHQYSEANDRRGSTNELAVQDDSNNVEVTDYYDLLQLTEEMLAGRNANRTNTVVSALVMYIVRSWRDYFARSVSMKLNCFFLLPFIHDFPLYFRNELDKLYDEENNANGIGELFDIRESRKELLQKRLELVAECDANVKLQQRFDTISAKLRKYNYDVTASMDTSESDINNAKGLHHSGSGRSMLRRKFASKSPGGRSQHTSEESMENV